MASNKQSIPVSDEEVSVSISGTKPGDRSSAASSANPWLIGVVVSLAAFMEVRGTSIANVALPHIAGSVGASNDESTWVLTSYLVSNAIVLPISGLDPLPGPARSNEKLYLVHR